jgi:hypothetical protein
MRPEIGIRKLFSLCVDVRGENAEIVSREKVPSICSESLPLLVEKPM